MSVAAIATVAIAIFVLGAFLLMVTNANNIAKTLESTVEIAVFLEVDLPRINAGAINNQITAAALPFLICSLALSAILFIYLAIGLPWIA